MTSILVAHRDPTIGHHVVGMIGQAGMIPVLVTDVSEALTASDRHAFDIMLVDVWMPAMNGVDLARHLLRGDPGLRVALISGFSVCWYECGINLLSPGVYSGPFHLRSLTNEIRRRLGFVRAAR